jgi:hypothetical protein
MSLDPRKLEKLRELANGVMQARCPACAEGGRDRAGEHLRIYPDGRFGCAVYPKDREHRKRIFALAGDRTPRQFTVKVATGKPSVEAARSVSESLATFRTLRTPVSESDSTPAATQEEFRTLRTPVLMSRACAGEDEGIRHDAPHTCKDNEKGVLSVLSPPVGRMPHFTPGGTLVIPFDCPERFHWWKPGGQSVKETTAEVRSWMAAEGKECHAPDF